MEAVKENLFPFRLSCDRMVKKYEGGLSVEEKVNSIIEILKARYPEAPCALHYQKDYEEVLWNTFGWYGKRRESEQRK